MKLVHIVARFKTYSGGEHLAFRLLREAVARGDRATVVTRHMPWGLRHHVPPGVEVRTLRWSHPPTRFHFLESICDVFYSLFLFALVPKESDCDIYWNDTTLASLFLDSFRCRKKLRMFYCLQLPHFAYGQTLLVTRSYPPLSWLVPLFVPLYRYLDRLFAHRADCILTLSAMVQADCRRVYRRDDIYRVSPGVDPPDRELIDRTFLRQKLSLRTEYILITVGKLIPKKNMEVFVDIVGRLRENGLDVGGVLVGEGPMRRKVADRIAHLGLKDHCRMTGFVEDYEDVLRLISGASLYLYLEKDVPFGLTPLEAGSMEVAVVAYDGGGVRETIEDGRNGYRIPQHHGADRIAEFLAELLQGDPRELARMGRRGQEMASARTWEASYAKIVEIVEQSLAPAAPNSP